MKNICTSIALLATCLTIAHAEAPLEQEVAPAPAPYPASGWKPSGRLLLLPIRQQEYQPVNQYGPPEQISATEKPKTTSQAEESDNASSFPASQQLQEQPGVTSGVYHVLLPDGRLQRVEFTTAPLQSEAAQSFTSPSQYQQKQESSKDNSFDGQYQSQPQEQTSNYQQSQNFEVAPVQQFAFPAAFPQTNEQNAKFTQGQAVGQSAFQKPSFQQNQFGLNTFQQTQSQQNHLGQSSFQQAPRVGRYQQGEGSQLKDGSGFSPKQQERQYLSPRPNFSPESQSNQYNTFQVSQSNSGVQSGNGDKFSYAQQQQNQQTQPQGFGYQQTEQSDAEAVPSPPTVSSGYVANVQYKDVEPIQGPIYSYNPAPLVRILRKTE